jgi:hypothetical protein
MHRNRILVMISAMVTRREIGVAIPLLLLNEHVEGLQLQLHMLNGVPDKLIDANNVMLARTHRILLTCNHGLQLEVVI